MIADPNLELHTLGCMLLDEDVAKKAAKLLQVEDFTQPEYRKIFQCVQDLATKQMAVDAATIYHQYLERYPQDSDCLQLLGDIAVSQGSSANFANYVTLLQRKTLFRKYEHLSETLHHAVEAQDLGKAKAVAEQIQTMQQTALPKAEGGLQDAASILTKVVAKLQEDFEQGKKPGVASGFVDLDNLTGGFQPGELCILAARPAMGKTALALDILRNVAASHGGDALFFSLEMPKEQIVGRLYCAATQEKSAIFQLLQVTKQIFAKFLQKFREKQPELQGCLQKIWINDSGAMGLEEIRSCCQTVTQQGKQISMIAIDYLQLMEVRGSENRTQEISKLTRGLKLLAKDYHCPVLCLSQLSRKVEDRADKRPLLSDLRESGSIEQDADVVAFLYRDEYYFPDSEKQHVAELILAKNRNGPCGSVNLTWIPQHTTFRSSAAWTPCKAKPPERFVQKKQMYIKEVGDLR